jgi:hypothetical protein
MKKMCKMLNVFKFDFELQYFHSKSLCEIFKTQILSFKTFFLTIIKKNKKY